MEMVKLGAGVTRSVFFTCVNSNREMSRQAIA